MLANRRPAPLPASRAPSPLGEPCKRSGVSPYLRVADRLACNVAALAAPFLGEPSHASGLHLAQPHRRAIAAAVPAPALEPEVRQQDVAVALEQLGGIGLRHRGLAVPAVQAHPVLADAFGEVGDAGFVHGRILGGGWAQKVRP